MKNIKFIKTLKEENFFGVKIETPNRDTEERLYLQFTNLTSNVIEINTEINIVVKNKETNEVRNFKCTDFTSIEHYEFKIPNDWGTYKLSIIFQFKPPTFYRYNKGKNHEVPFEFGYRFVVR